MASRVVEGAAFAVLCGIWGSTWLAILIGLEGAPAFLSASLRFALASATLLGLALAFRRPAPRTRVEWGLVVFVGLVLFTADYGLIYWGENNGVESALSAILFATFPFQTAIAAHAILATERLTVQKVVGTVVGFGGVLLIFRGQLQESLAALFPMLAIVLAAACAAVSSVALKRWGHDTDPVSFNAFAMGVGGLALAVLSLGAGEAWRVPSWPEGILAIVYLALAGSVVTFVTWIWLLKRIEATSLSYVAFVTPIIAVLLGVALAGEVFDPLTVVGAGVVLAGIYTSTSKRAGAWLRVAIGAGAVAEGADGPTTSRKP